MAILLPGRPHVNPPCRWSENVSLLTVLRFCHPYVGDSALDWNGTTATGGVEPDADGRSDWCRRGRSLGAVGAAGAPDIGGVSKGGRRRPGSWQLGTDPDQRARPGAARPDRGGC